MGAGLSLAEQTEEFRKSGIKSRAGHIWSGKLEEWLATVLPPGAYERYDTTDSDHTPGVDGPKDDETWLEWTERQRVGVQTWSFPTDDLRTEYLQSVSKRDEADVFALLRLFLFEESCFAKDTEYLHEAIYVRRDIEDPDWLPTEYWRRLLRWTGGDAMPHPSIRWTLDLLPHSPQQAIDAITGYLHVYRGTRPGGRSEGLLDAIAIIRARWIEDLSAGTQALFQLSPRDLELVVAALYRQLGYTVELTPPSRDGGRDVIATRALPGQSDVVEIECKAHTSPVGVGIARQLQGVVARSGANRGVLVTIGRFTRGAQQAANEDSRLELVDGTSLARMLNAMFGPLWYQDRGWICRNLK
ncbi:restriction endonuclease [Amycolatopsis sp. NPDC059657]|uniref:restriction endonuclease n=1 Tax=Amycolatopsis sp. NPDC059657 TaxID=3346899 RepID=UPI00366AB5E6